MSEPRIIGIAGGMGPHAGLDLHRKILDLTGAGTDQQHLPVVHVSFSHRIGDRTGWLVDRKGENPAHGILHTIRALDSMGVHCIGIPCNTAHATPIFGVIEETMKIEGARARLLHMPREVIARLREGSAKHIGMLSTNGTRKARIYQDLLQEAGLEPVTPEPDIQERVSNSIYHGEHGIKAKPDPVTEWAREELLVAVDHLIEKGAETILLACTELPLALPEPDIKGVPLLDNTLVLARAMIREIRR